MFKKSNYWVMNIFVLSLLFSACTSSSTTGTNRANTTVLTQSTQTVLGILKLEGTPLVVTIDQAKTLIVLYKAEKSMSADTGSSPAELSALLIQINTSLTPAQTLAITQMNITAASMNTIMSDLGIQSGSTTGTRTANSAGGGGGFAGGGNISVTGGGTASGATTVRTTTVGGTSTRQVQITPALLTAVIDLLSKRAGVPTTTPTPAPASQATDIPTPGAVPHATDTPAP